MRKPLLALLVLVLVPLAGPGCGSGSDDKTPPGDDDGGGDDVPPFTNGVSMLSGSAEPGYLDGARGKARFANPVNVACGPDGRIYVADFDNGKIRVVDADTGETSTLIATGGFQRPFGMAFGGNGTLYVSTDRDPQGMSGPMAGTLWRVDVGARMATPLATRIGRPRGLAVLPDGTIAVADYLHHVIELFDPNTGGLMVLAGAWDAKGYADGVGDAARFSTPYSLAYVNGGLVVADFENHRLRRIELDGRVSTLAGTGAAGFADGSLGAAKFNKPQGVAADANGDLYISDLENFRIRRIHGGTVETIAGSGEPGYADDDNRLAAKFYGLEGLCVEPDGSMVYVADGSRGEEAPYHRIRSVKLK